MSAAAAAMILGVVLIVLALVYFLVSTIFQLRKIVAGLDRVILHVGGIVEKSAPVGEVVNDINANLDAGVSALEGLLVKKAGIDRRHRPDRRPLPGRGRAGPARLPGEHGRRGAADRRGLHARHADARAARPRGADRRRQPERPGAAQRAYGSAASRTLYPEGREPGARELPRSPVIGTDSPEQYERREDIGQPRKRFPAKQS